MDDSLILVLLTIMKLLQYHIYCPKEVQNELAIKDRLQIRLKKNASGFSFARYWLSTEKFGTEVSTFPRNKAKWLDPPSWKSNHFKDLYTN